MLLPMFQNTEDLRWQFDNTQPPFLLKSAERGVALTPFSANLTRLWRFIWSGCANFIKVIVCKAWQRYLFFVLTLDSGGGLMQPPWVFFCNGHWTAGQITRKFCIPYGASFALLVADKFWPGQVRSQSYDVTGGTASDRFVKEIVFSAT